MSIQSRELPKATQLKSSIKRVKDNVTSYEASEDALMKEVALAINDSTRPSQAFDNIRAEVADLRERLGARHGVIPSVAEVCVRRLGRSSEASLKTS